MAVAQGPTMGVAYSSVQEHVEDMKTDLQIVINHVFFAYGIGEFYK